MTEFPIDLTIRTAQIWRAFYEGRTTREIAWEMQVREFEVYNLMTLTRGGRVQQMMRGRLLARREYQSAGGCAA